MALSYYRIIVAMGGEADEPVREHIRYYRSYNRQRGLRTR